MFCYRLLDILAEKQAKADTDLAEITSILSDIFDTKNSLLDSQKEIAGFYLYGEDVEGTETDLLALTSRVQERIKQAKALVKNARDKYVTAQQVVPSDVSQELTNLELLIEAILSAMDDKEREFKKARTVRSDYLTDVEAVQAWIKEAELKVQDRSIEPQLLNDNLQQIQSEIGGISDRLERLTKNGKSIVEKSRSDEEKQLIQSTIDTLTNQLQQVRTWLEEKKQQVSETLDAWQRFLNMYQAVMTWVREKQVFLQEPLYISTLQEAKQKLHDYSVSIILYVMSKLCYTLFNNCRTLSKVVKGRRRI